MFSVLKKSLSTGIVTSGYPEGKPAVSAQSRTHPIIDFANWKDARAAVAACPSQALSLQDTYGERSVAFDMGRCLFCGECASADPSIRMSSECELAVTSRAALITRMSYRLARDGTHQQCLQPSEKPAKTKKAYKDNEVKEHIQKVLGRSLHIREVDAGSCNGCEVEVHALNSPIYDAERFGIHFVASPRHADMLLVTGPVTRNMELALRKTFNAMPSPRLVVASGACACGGGVFGQNYATIGSVDRVVPVDVFIPGCPPNPHALLHGILLALGRIKAR